MRFCRLVQPPSLPRACAAVPTMPTAACAAVPAPSPAPLRLLDNIGARRLHTVLERVMSDISFSASEKAAAARAEGKDG